MFIEPFFYFGISIPIIFVKEFINAIINFVIVAFALFLLIRQINKLAAPKPAEVAVTPEDVLLLREIRDSLKK